MEEKHWHIVIHFTDRIGVLCTLKVSYQVLADLTCRGRYDSSTLTSEYWGFICDKRACINVHVRGGITILYNISNSNFPCPSSNPTLTLFNMRCYYCHSSCYSGRFPQSVTSDLSCKAKLVHRSWYFKCLQFQYPLSGCLCLELKAHCMRFS